MTAVEVGGWVRDGRILRTFRWNPEMGERQVEILAGELRTWLYGFGLKLGVTPIGYSPPNEAASTGHSLVSLATVYGDILVAAGEHVGVLEGVEGFPVRVVADQALREHWTKLTI